MKRKNTWAKAIVAEERFKKENAVSGDDMLLSTHIKGLTAVK